MERNFFRYVWRYSKREQIFILALTVLSFPLVYFSLEIPKMIVNDAIDGRDFPRVIFGVEFGQIPYLLLLCAAFLGMVVLINGVKWVMNIAIGMTGERMLRRLRFQLFEQVMRFRMRRFRSTKPGEVVQSLMGEIEPLGGFIGEVIATPAFQGGLLCVYIFFIFMQDWLLGLAAISLYPIQAWLIPYLQAKVVRLNKERAGNNRELADTISESVGQIGEIHTNDTARWHMAQIAGRLYTNTLIRMQIFRRKFTIKFVNNFLNQLTPFFFYSIGGYLVIKGDLDFGALVAVLAAYKDLAGPWKEVLGYVQRWSDFNGRYRFVIDNFVGEDVAPPERIWDDAGRVRPLSGELAIDHLDGGPGTGGLQANGIAIEPGSSVAVTGGHHGSREALLRMMTGLSTPQSGTVRLGGQVLSEATLPQIGRSLAFVAPDPGMVNRTLRDNMIYGLLTHVPERATGEPDMQRRREAEATGNIAADPEGDWVDYEAAGVADAEALEARLLALVERFGLAAEVYGGALAARIGQTEAEAWTGPVLAARRALADATGSAEIAALLEPWERARFNRNATLLENLLFALPVEGGGDVAALVEREAVRELLVTSGGMAELETIGWLIATEFAELVETVAAQSSVLDGFPGYPRGEVMAAAELVREKRKEGLSAQSASSRRRLAALAGRFVPMRDRLDVLTGEIEARVLACRARVLEALGDRQDFVRFDDHRLSPALSIAENILAAKRRFDRKPRWRQLDVAMEDAIREVGLRDELMRRGLDAPAGPGGASLTAMARRRVGLIRAVIKRPSMIVLDGVAGGGSETDLDLRQAIRDEVPGVTLIWAAERATEAPDAAIVLTIGDDGTVTEETTDPARMPAGLRDGSKSA